MPLSIAGIRVQASGSNPYFPQSKQNRLPSRPDDSSMQKKAPRECWLDRGAAARLGWGQELSGAEHSNTTSAALFPSTGESAVQR
jgi:hypothetical protein